MEWDLRLGERLPLLTVVDEFNVAVFIVVGYVLDAATIDGC